jgi:hypothetical protein
MSDDDAIVVVELAQPQNFEWPPDRTMFPLLQSFGVILPHCHSVNVFLSFWLSVFLSACLALVLAHVLLPVSFLVYILLIKAQQEPTVDQKTSN